MTKETVTLLLAVVIGGFALIQVFLLLSVGLMEQIALLLGD